MFALSYCIIFYSVWLLPFRGLFFSKEGTEERLDPGERGVMSGELRKLEGGEVEVRVYYMRETFIINKIE